MELIQATLPLDHELNVAACFHFGNSTQHKEGIRDYVEYVSRGTNRRAIFVGDILEGINPKDKRFDQTNHRMTISEQEAEAEEVLAPIKGKTLVASRGNHESGIKNNGDIIRDTFCRHLGILYGTVSFKLIVRDPKGNLQYKGFFTHPHSGVIRSSHPDPIMREASEKVQLKRRLARERMGDCILNMAAHFHKAIDVDPYKGQELFLIDDGHKIKQRYIAEADPRAEYIDEDLRWYGSVPGWIRKYGELGTDSYVEQAGYDPLPIGYMRVTVRGGKIMAMDKVLIQ